MNINQFTIVNFTPWVSLIGGIVIGIASSLMLAVLGRITGISGIIGGLLENRKGDRSWRWFFLGGLFLGGAVMAYGWPQATMLSFDYKRGPVILALGGFLVGFGTRLGGGCTSGHGVCGLPRFSKRSLVATLLFMAAGMFTVALSSRFHLF